MAPLDDLKIVIGLGLPKSEIKKRVIHLLPGDITGALVHESRHLAHYAIVSHVYDSNPVAARKLIKKEKEVLYEKLTNFSLRKCSRVSYYSARLLHDKGLLNNDEVELEKFIHFNSITTGLKESFADASNRDRNVVAGLVASALVVFGIGLYKSITGDEPIPGASAWIGGGIATPFLFLIPKYYYRNSRSLTPKNLERFTPIERRHLLAFPSDYRSLERRCEELKDYGFPL